MSEERIKEIEELCEKATPGKWFAGNSDIGYAPVNVMAKDRGYVAFSCSQEDALFIAQSRQIVPELLEEVKLYKKVFEGRNDKTGN